MLTRRDVLAGSAAPKNPFRSIRHIPGQPVTYLQNPKVACTSIKLMLLQAHDPGWTKAHGDIGEDKFIRRPAALTRQSVDSLLSSQFFSVVRNPYVRMLAAYLDKARPGMKLWARLAPTFGLSPDATPSLADLLSAIADHYPVSMDHHFRPQHLNLLHDFAPLDAVFHLEHPNDIRSYLASFGFHLPHHAKHSTNSIEKMNLIDAKAEKLIRDYYADDFHIYGYSEDISVLTPVRPVERSADRAKITQYVTSQSPSSHSPRAGRE